MEYKIIKNIVFFLEIKKSIVYLYDAPKSLRDFVHLPVLLKAKPFAKPAGVVGKRGDSAAIERVNKE